MRARDVMTRPVVTVTPSTSAKQAAELFVQHGFTALPVVDDDGVLAGVVIEADILHDRIGPDPRTLIHAERSVQPTVPPAFSVGAVMTTKVVTRGPNADAAELAKLMLEHHVRAIPITDQGVVTGIVTRRDLLRTIARDDHAISVDVRHHLDRCFRRGNWSATVRDGVVTLTDEYGDETDQHIATVVASAVPGVVDVRIVTPSAR